MVELLQTISRPLSDEDTRDILGPDCKVMKYSGLAEKKGLEDLLPSLRRCAIILYEEDEALAIG